MTRAIVPIANLTRRVPEAGRIRMGERHGKAMRAIDTFRFTSHDKAALDQIAALYGGEVVPWSDPKAADGQFEVKTGASEIRVVLPPDPLGGTPVYECWGGGGCERRCDGVTCTTLQRGPDGLEPIDVDCLCVAKGEIACDVKTRLSVMLPEIRFAGTWRLDTKGWNAAQELPGMVELVQKLQGQGLSYATLAIKHRRSVAGGQTRKFLVPVLGTPATLEQIASGESRLGALPSTDQSAGALEAGEAPEASEEGEAAYADDEVIEAEVVDDPEPTGPTCSICGAPYGDEPLLKGRSGESAYVHKACRKEAA